MVSTPAAFICYVTLLAAVAVMLVGAHEWEYDAQELWVNYGRQCGPTGVEQSPIAINTSQTMTPATGMFGSIVLGDGCRFASNMIRRTDNYSIMIVEFVPAADAASCTMVDPATGADLILESVNFHISSEHPIDGERPNATALWYFSTHPSASEQVKSIVSVRLEANATLDNTTNLASAVAYSEIFSNMPFGEGGASANVTSPSANVLALTFDEMLPPEVDRDYITYKGSMPYPPCLEDRRWYLLEKPVRISEIALKRYITDLTIAYTEFRNGNILNVRDLQTAANQSIYRVPALSQRIDNGSSTRMPAQDPVVHIDVVGEYNTMAGLSLVAVAEAIAGDLMKLPVIMSSFNVTMAAATFDNVTHATDFTSNASLNGVWHFEFTPMKMNTTSFNDMATQLELVAQVGTLQSNGSALSSLFALYNSTFNTVWAANISIAPAMLLNVTHVEFGEDDHNMTMAPNATGIPTNGSGVDSIINATIEIAVNASVLASNLRTVPALKVAFQLGLEDQLMSTSVIVNNIQNDTTIGRLVLMVSVEVNRTDSATPATLFNDTIVAIHALNGTLVSSWASAVGAWLMNATVVDVSTVPGLPSTSTPGTSGPQTVAPAALFKGYVRVVFTITGSNAVLERLRIDKRGLISSAAVQDMQEYLEKPSGNVFLTDLQRGSLIFTLQVNAIDAADAVKVAEKGENLKNLAPSTVISRISDMYNAEARPEERNATDFELRISSSSGTVVPDDLFDGEDDGGNTTAILVVVIIAVIIIIVSAIVCWKMHSNKKGAANRNRSYASYNHEHADAEMDSRPPPAPGVV